MADEPQPIAQNLQSQTPNENVVSSNPFVSGVKSLFDFSKSFVAGQVDDRLQQAKDFAFDVVGPQQISFKVQKPAITGDNDRGNAWQSSLRYPADVRTEDTDYMLFQFYRYEPPFGRGGNGVLNLGQQGTGGASGEYGMLGEYNSSSQNLQTDDFLNQVVLYMPPDVAAAYGANWNAKGFSNTAVATIRAGMAAASGNGFSAIQGTAENWANSATRAKNITGADMVRKMLADRTGEDISRNDLFASTSGAILNPNVELLFDGHQMRSVDFTYKLIPHNLEEAKIILEICDTFKKCMHPSFGIPGRNNGAKLQGGLGLFNSFSANAEEKVGFVAVPSVCKFAFMKGAGLHPYLPQYKTCAISNVNVNYTPDGAYATTRDGYPAAVELKISLKELKLVYREDIGPVSDSQVNLNGLFSFGASYNKSLNGGH